MMVWGSVSGSDTCLSLCSAPWVSLPSRPSAGAYLGPLCWWKMNATQKRVVSCQLGVQAQFSKCWTTMAQCQGCEQGWEEGRRRWAAL